MVKSISLSKFEKIKEQMVNVKCNMGNITGVITMIFGIIIASVILSSLNKLEHSNCKCAQLPERRFLKEWFIFMLIYYISLLLLFGFSNEACWYNFMNYPYIYGIVFIISWTNIVMLIRLFIYIFKLRNDCSCGYGNKEAFIFWYMIVVFSIMAFVIISSLTIIISTAIKFFSYRMNNNN